MEIPNAVKADTMESTSILYYWCHYVANLVALSVDVYLLEGRKGWFPCEGYRFAAQGVGKSKSRSISRQKWFPLF